MDDNACGGLRGNRAELTKELIELLSYEYGFDKSAKYIDIKGSSSLNLRVEKDKIRYVVRAYRPHVSPRRFEDMLRIRRELNQNGIPCSTIFKTSNDKEWITWNDRIIEVEYFVENDGVMDTMEKLGFALPLFGKMTSVLGEMHDISADGKNPYFANQIHFERIIEMTEKGCARILSWNPSESEREIISMSKALAEKVVHAGEKIFSHLPKQLAHGDYWHNNVLFNGDKIVLIADFDFMGERRRIEDIALTLYFSHISEGYCKSEAMSIGRAIELKQLLNLYESGLKTRLSEMERIALPIAIALQALWGIGGWVVLLDDDHAARNHAADMMHELKLCNYIMDNLNEWYDVFCR